MARIRNRKGLLRDGAELRNGGRDEPSDSACVEGATQADENE